MIETNKLFEIPNSSKFHMKNVSTKQTNRRVMENQPFQSMPELKQPFWLSRRQVTTPQFQDPQSAERHEGERCRIPPVIPQPGNDF
jgi:hypothetical protein